MEPGQRSGYSDWLRAGRPRSGSSSPGSQEFYLLHIVQTGSGAHPASYPIGTRSKEAGAWIWPLTSNYCQGQENVDLYIHSPTRLHGVVLN
jgi:hypothetical protein